MDHLAAHQHRRTHCLVGWLLVCPFLIASQSVIADEPRRGPLTPNQEAATLQLADDSDQAIRFRLALVLGASDPRGHLPALVKLAQSVDKEPWTALALSGSLGPVCGPFLAAPEEKLLR